MTVKVKSHRRFAPRTPNSSRGLSSRRRLPRRTSTWKHSPSQHLLSSSLLYITISRPLASCNPENRLRISSRKIRRKPRSYGRRHLRWGFRPFSRQKYPILVRILLRAPHSPQSLPEIKTLSKSDLSRGFKLFLACCDNSGQVI